MHVASVMTPGIPRHQHHIVMQYNEENICTHNRKNICTHHTSMAHVINKHDLEDYIKCLVKKRGCTVDKVDRQNSHWYFIFHKAECMKEIKEYRADKHIDQYVARDSKLGQVEEIRISMWINLNVTFVIKNYHQGQTVHKPK